MPLDPKHSEASFSPNLTDLPCLRVAKVCLDVEIWLFFVDNDNDNNDNDRTDYFTPAHARGVIIA